MKKYISFLFIFYFILSFHFSNAQYVFNQSYDHDSMPDVAKSVIQTNDGGYIACGATYNIFTSTDAIFIVKTDGKGDTLWTKALQISTTGMNLAESVIESSDNSYIVCGTIQDTVLLKKDIVLMKLNNNGNLDWIKFFGGTNNDGGFMVKETIDKGFIIVGYTSSFTNGGNDVYLIKTDSLGNLLWQKNYGGIGSEIGYSLDLTNDGGIIIGGRTNSYGSGFDDLYMIKTDSLGNMQWQKTFGTTGDDYGQTVLQTLDGGYIIVGHIDVGLGNQDAYIVKTDSAGNIQWDNTFNFGTDYNAIYVIRQLPDSSYIASGSIYRTPSVEYQGMIMKISQNGDSLWSRFYGDYKSDYFYDIQLTSDKGFVMCGVFNRIGPPYQNLWIVKTDSLGISCNFDTTGCSQFDCSYLKAQFSQSADTVSLLDSTPVQFYDSSLYSSQWFWDFGDNSTDTNQHPVHIYDSVGTYTVTLVVSYSNCSDTAYDTVVVNDFTGISDKIFRNNIQIYPNPNTSEFFIEIFSQSKEKKLQIKLFNITGQVIYKENQIQLTKAYKKKIDLQGYAKGIYYLQIIIDTEMIYKKVVLE